MCCCERRRQADVADDTGATPLFLACTNRSAALVERLLQARRRRERGAVSGETVLMTCARTGEAAGVRALLARGAHVNAKEPAHEQTALMWAAAQAMRRPSRRCWEAAPTCAPARAATTRP